MHDILLITTSYKVLKQYLKTKLKGMIKMCIRISESKFKSIKEINALYNCKELKLSYIDLENMKNDRKTINKKLKLAEQFKIMALMDY